VMRHIWRGVCKNPPRRRRAASSEVMLAFEPLGYLALLNLTANVRLVLRENTERPVTATQGTNRIVGNAPGRIVSEALAALDGKGKAGTVKIVGTDRADIVALTQELLDNSTLHGIMARAVNPYGDGCAAARILEALQRAERAVA